MAVPTTIMLVPTIDVAVQPTEKEVLPAIRQGWATDVSVQPTKREALPKIMEVPTKGMAI